MAFRRALAQRLYGASRMAQTSSRVSSPCAAVVSKALNQLVTRKDAIFRRYIHRQSLALPTELRFLPTGEKLAQKVRELDIGRDRIRLDVLRPRKEEDEDVEEVKLTLKDAVKILRLSQLEMVKSSLKKINKDCISYPEFMEICAKTCASVDQGVKIAKMLDQSGTVIVLGNNVFLRPEKVMNSIVGLILPDLTSKEHQSSTRKELEQLEKQKSEIDQRANEMVRRELTGGLAFLILQTAAFMRLTFWELSWDVMEPICFYVTSMYFMAGYGFFLRTSKEPSFEGFYQSRFDAKRKKLMKVFKFDSDRYERLKKGRI